MSTPEPTPAPTPTPTPPAPTPAPTPPAQPVVVHPAQPDRSLQDTLSGIVTSLQGLPEKLVDAVRESGSATIDPSTPAATPTVEPTTVETTQRRSFGHWWMGKK